MKNRAYSLDAFRGCAIILMVLSGTVAWGVLPGWMYHAQVGPRSNFIFDPSIYGITWVDLVFPFFLFAMGASFPFSIGNKYRNGVSKLNLLKDIFLRAIRLTFFAIFIQHMYPHVTSSPETAYSWWLAILAFLLMFPMFMNIPYRMPNSVKIAMKVVAYGLAIAILFNVSYANGRVFSLSYSNIIILVLANMALFGGIIYLFTIKNNWARIAVLPLLMAILLSSNTEGSWAEFIFKFSPLPWFYQFNYLKYLFIIITGSVAGEYLYHWLHHLPKDESSSLGRTYLSGISLLCISIILVNVYNLYMRYLVLNVVVTILLLGLLYWLLKRKHEHVIYWRKMFAFGAYLLLLGLCFEAFEGGIRKDHATFSYYFVTSGLAFIAMITFSIWCDIYKVNFLTKPLVYAGQNPMIAYVTPQLVIMPVLKLTGLSAYLTLLESNAWLGFLRGVIITLLTVLITLIFTRLKCFWRT